jgi:hypothetical protein
MPKNKPNNNKNNNKATANLGFEQKLWLAADKLRRSGRGTGKYADVPGF